MGLTTYSVISFSQESSIQLNYSDEDNSLSLISKDIKLKNILGLLSIKSGINTSIHPKANKNITITIKQKPIKQAINSLCKGLNCITHFDTDPLSGKSIITGLEVLPKGNHQTIMLTGTVPLSNEINIHAKKHQSEKYSRIQKRLELRLNSLPITLRESMSEEYASQIQYHTKKQAKREKHREQRKNKKELRDKHRQAIRDKLKQYNPERFALSEQRRLDQENKF